jgi:NADP-dependent 3-hydroxy acid dehydrogenase YdfG
LPVMLVILTSIPGLVKDIINRFGQVDILVNNAGINMIKRIRGSNR